MSVLLNHFAAHLKLTQRVINSVSIRKETQLLGLHEGYTNEQKVLHYNWLVNKLRSEGGMVREAIDPVFSLFIKPPGILMDRKLSHCFDHNPFSSSNNHSHSAVSETHFLNLMSMML